MFKRAPGRSLLSSQEQEGPAWAKVEGRVAQAGWGEWGVQAQVFLFAFLSDCNRSHKSHRLLTRCYSLRGSGVRVEAGLFTCDTILED